MSKDKHKSRDRRYRTLRWVGAGRMLSSGRGDKNVGRLVREGRLRIERRCVGSVFGDHIRRTFVMPTDS